MRWAVVVLALLCSACLHHDPWTREDTYRHAGLTGLMVVDWQQTREIAEKPDQYWETNCILGKHPNTAKVDRYFVGAALFNFGAAWFLPAEYRDDWQWFCVGVSATLVGHNYRIGLRGEW